ncbi:uncharacterized protein LOC112033855 [Quercus suber]|uniref:uncharacterized protein LOC112033855 n=1 Tax=Quercus suber TaxID=58331 RepID=UPI000CE245C3|nr:uncharacterized protein LOC112033855 [Quercus suber]
MTLSLQQPPDEIVCQSFPTTLKGVTRVWFSKLAQSSIDDFDQLSNLFVHHFIGGQRQKIPADHFLTIKQEDGESLRFYVKRFNREVLEVDEAEDQVQLTTFKAGLRSKKFIVALTKSPPALMTNLLMKAQKYMNAEDALTPIEVGGTRISKTNPRDDQKGQKRERRDHPSNNNRSKQREDKARKMVNFTPW